jgi:CheY-like chemotaxis protein
MLGGRGGVVLFLGRSLLGGVLSRAGYSVSTACDGGEAFEVLRQARGCVDVLLADLMMPGIDGFELIRQVRKERMAATVVAMTGLGEEGMVADAVRAGASIVLEKPFPTDDLLRTIHDALHGARTAGSVATREGC